MRSSVQSAGLPWAAEGEPPEGSAGLLRRTGGPRPGRASFTDQCAPSKGQGAERQGPFPGLCQKGYGAAGGAQTREAGEVGEGLIRKVL